MEEEFDLDQVQEWGETALITLTQLWRQLPRIDTEAASKLSDQVVDARKSIEKLVKAACSTHRNLEASDRLYEPLPYGTGSHHHRSHSNQHLRSPSGNERGVSSFSHTSFTSGAAQDQANSMKRQQRSGSGNNLPGVDVYDSDNDQNQQQQQPDGQPYSPTDAVRAAARGHIISEQRQNRNAAGETTTDIVYDDYDPDSPERKLFRTEIRVPGVPNIIFEDPEGTSLADTLSQKGKTANSKLALMVQFAERREQMWKNHAKFLQDKTELDEIQENEMHQRYDISLESAQTRERIVAEFSSGLPIVLALSMTSKKKKRGSAAASNADTDEKSCLLDGVRDSLREGSGSPNRHRLLSELNEDEKFTVLTERVTSLQSERNMMIEEMAKLSTECTRLSRENNDLTKKTQELPPGPSPELEKVTNDLAELRKKIMNQSERSRSISRTGSPAIEGGYYVPPQGGGAATQQQRSASHNLQQQQQQQMMMQHQQQGTPFSPFPQNPNNNNNNNHNIIDYTSANQEDEEFDEEEEEEEVSSSESPVSSSEDENDASGKKKITSVADAVLLLIKKQRLQKKAENDKTARNKKTRRGGKKSRNQSQNQGYYNYQQGDSAFFNDQNQNAAKMGNFGDDSLVPAQVLRASKVYFKDERSQQQKRNNNNNNKSSSRKSTPNKTTPRETHLLESNNETDEKQQQDQEEEEDPDFADLEKRNREILNRLKEEASQREKKEHAVGLSASQRSNSPYHREGDVVSRSVAFLKKQQEAEEMARKKKSIHYAFGTPVKEPLPAPSGKKPHFSKFYNSKDHDGADEDENNDNNNGSKNNSPSTPSRSLGYLKWQFRKDQQEKKNAASSSRRQSSSKDNNNNNTGNKTPPTPSLNSVLDKGANVIRLEAEDSETDGTNNNNNRRSSTTSQLQQQQHQKQQIGVRSAGKVAQAASSSSSSTGVKKPLSKPAAGKKIPVPKPAPKKTTTALEDLANDHQDQQQEGSSSSQQQKETPQEGLKSIVFEREMRVVVQSERAGRADILTETATYYTNQASALGKESLDWFEMMKALREDDK